MRRPGAGGLAMRRMMAILALTALAFVLIYKATRVINLAVSEMLTLGGYPDVSLVAAREKREAAKAVRAAAKG